MTRPSRLLLGATLFASIASVGYAVSNASTTGADKVVAVASESANVFQGKTIYAERCAICHEKAGMGPSLRGEKSRKDQAAAVAWIKNPKPPMPKLYPSRLSDKDVSDVAAYVETMTGPPEASQASAHRGGATVAGAGSVTHGKLLYAQSCAGCHGATGIEGGAGPSLKGENGRKDEAAAIAWIKNPKPPMPKLFPSPLSEKDVNDVAAYVESL